MAGPGGVEVGRAALVVLPDLSKFTASLRKFVERIERQVVVELPTTLDPRGVQQDIEALKERVRRSPAEVPVEPTQIEEFARRVRADVTAATRTLEARVPLTADGDRLRRDVAAQVDSIEHLLSLDVPLEPGSFTKFRREVLDQVAVVQAMVRTHPVQVPVTYDRSNLDRLQGALSRIGSSGGESRGLSFRAKLYTAIGLAAAFAAPNILSLAGGLAQLAGLAALLPGVLTAASVGVGTLVLGFQGFGKALKALRLGDADKLREAMKNLAPAARQVVLALKDLGPAFKRLRLGVQQKLFSGLGKTITTVARTYLPVLTKGLGQVATGFNRLVKQFAKGLIDPRVLRDMRSIFADVGDTITRLAPGIRLLTRAFISISHVGADMLPGLADGFTNAMKRFDAFIDRVRKNGDLRKFMQGGLDALHDLGSLLFNTGRFLGGLISAAQAAGAGGLKSFADAMKRIADVVNSPTFQRGLTLVFDGLHDGLKSITDSFPAIGQAFAALAPGIADLARAFGSGLGQLLSDIAGAFIAMAPTINAIASGLADMNPNWLALGLALPIVWGIVSKLVPVFAALPEIIGAIASPVGLVVLAIAAAVGGFILLYQHSQPVRDAFQGIIDAALSLWATVQPIFAQLAGVVRDNWPQIQATAQAVFTAVEAIVIAVLTNIRVQIQVVTAIIQVLWAAFGDTIMAVVRVAFPGVLAIIRGVLGSITGIVRAFTAALNGDWSGALDQLKAAWSGAWDAVVALLRTQASAVVAVVKSLGPKFIAATKSFGTLLEHAGEDLMRGLAQGIKNLATAPVRAMQGIANDVLGAAKGVFRSHSPSRAMHDIGLMVTQGLTDGIRVGSPKAVQQIRELADQVNAAMVKAASGITVAIGKATDKGFKLTKARTDVGAWINASLLAGLTGTEAQVKSTIAQLGKKVQQVFVAAAGKSKSAQRQAVKDAAAYVRSLTVSTNALAALSKVRADVAGKLKDAQQNLDQLLTQRSSFQQSVQQATAQFGSVTAAFEAVQQANEAAARATGQDAAAAAAVTSGDIISQLMDRLAQIKTFAKTLADLRAAGLNNATYQEIVQAGVEQGQALAAAIAAGGPQALTQINDLTKQIGDQASSLGATAASQLYDAGIAAAQGLVKGLESQTAALDAAAKRIADRLVKQVKATLGIKSPSRVMAMEVGVPMAQGILAGFQKGIPDLRSIVAGVVPTVQAASLKDALATQLTPSVLEVRDVDGALVGRMRVEGQRAVEGTVDGLLAQVGMR